METPFDPKFKRNNKADVDWWNKYDQLPPEARELIMYDNCKPNSEILLVAAELTGCVFPQLPTKPLNKKQRAWLERQENNRLEAERRRQAWNKRMLRQKALQEEYGGWAQQIAPKTVLTKQQLVEMEQKKLSKQEAEQRKLHKVLGLDEKINYKEVYLRNS